MTVIIQGQLHMWVDIFQKSNFIRPPVDISPRKPVMCELRVVVWNTKDVLLDEKSFVTGEDMSDIYVKGYKLSMSVCCECLSLRQHQ